MTVSGQHLTQLEQESGIHRLQRISKTEKRGRVHTSSVIVSVINPDDERLTQFQTSAETIKDDDFAIEWFNGTVKAGGQFRNKTATACRLTHIPTGVVKTAQTRSRQNSLKLAKEAILKDIREAQKSAFAEARQSIKDEQIAPNRKRMWAFQRDVVEDYETGKQIGMKEALRGKVDKLWR